MMQKIKIKQIITYSKYDIDWNFWKKANIATENECWEWKRNLKPFKYGVYRQEYAHRYAYKEFNGLIEEDKWILHKCGNYKCINPNHLYAGTPLQNSSDRERHRREKYGYRKIHNIYPKENKMTQDRNNNYRCDDEHLNKIEQLANLMSISKSEVMRRIVDSVYGNPGLLEKEDDAE